MSKVAKKVVVARLNAHLTEYGLRDDFQSTYTSFLIVETALLKVHYDIMIAINNKREVLLVLLNLSAAFDTIDHKILLHRLHFQFGVQGTAINKIILSMFTFRGIYPKTLMLYTVGHKDLYWGLYFSPYTYHPLAKQAEQLIHAFIKT